MKRREALDLAVLEAIGQFLRDQYQPARYHTFDVLEPEDRPRDTYGDGRSLRFITSEHDEMAMPQAIEVRDAEGRWAVYVPLEIDARSYDRSRRSKTNLSLAPAGVGQRQGRRPSSMAR
jgi:hypothetical protein